MTQIKAYTDLEQSKKLAEILQLESADMHYGNFSPKGLGYKNKFCAGLTSYTKEIKVYEELKESYKIKDYNGIVAWRVIPCWSSTALLEVIRNNGRYDLQMYEGGYYFEANGFITESYFNPVDACYEMILKLYELNLL